MAIQLPKELVELLGQFFDGVRTGFSVCMLPTLSA
ncbi:hypothetical protein BN949_02686 [Agrobacterium tumefaciens]|nr:hypothetical protein BN949_02686 [Agrobacterium tumefaciens]